MHCFELLSGKYILKDLIFSDSRSIKHSVVNNVITYNIVSMYFEYTACRSVSWKQKSANWMQFDCFALPAAVLIAAIFQIFACFIAFKIVQPVACMYVECQTHNLIPCIRASLHT